MLTQINNYFALYLEKRRHHRDERSDKEKTDEEKAREMIKKAKVEDDEYKTEEQTYYRYVLRKQIILTNIT